MKTGCVSFQHSPAATAHWETNALRLAYLESIRLCKVDGDGEQQRNIDVNDLSSDMAQWQVADKYLLRLTQLTHLSTLACYPYQLQSTKQHQPVQ